MTSYDMGSLRVLVVDDSPYMVTIIETLLGAMGVKEIRGIDATRGVVAELKSWRPDLIIIDHMMKPKNGLEVIRDIRDLEGDPQRFVPVVLMTGYAHRGVVNQARFRAGADAVLTKPVSVSRLHDCIVALHDSARLFVRTRNYFGPDRRALDRPFEGLDRDFDGPWNPHATPGIPVKLRDESLELELVVVKPAGGAPAPEAGDARGQQALLASTGGNRR